MAEQDRVDREGRTLRGVTATRLIDLLQEHVNTHGNSEVLVDTEDGFGLTIREARSRESYQSNPLVFVVQADAQDEPQQLGE